MAERTYAGTLATWMAAVLFCGSLAAVGLVQRASAEQTQTHCPVMGGEIDPSLFADYRDVRVYFCCTGCVDPFRRAPQDYIAKMEAEGIEPEAIPPRAGGSDRKPGENRDGHSEKGHSSDMPCTRMR